MRSAGVPLAALLLAIVLLSAAALAAGLDHGRERDATERALTAEAAEQTEKLEHYFSRAASLTQVTARNPAFREFYEQPGSRSAKVRAQGRTVRESNEALSYLEALFKGSIGEACFIDRSGPENARAVRGEIAPIGELSNDETKAPFFKRAFALRPGEVYQARPYVSPDTHDWVVANATPVATGTRSPQAIVHFEVTMESFREQAADTSDMFDVAIVEAATGKVVADTRYPQPAGDESKLGRPSDRRFARLASTAGQAFKTGTLEVDGRPSAFRALARGKHNDNRWVVVASSRAPAGTLLSQFGLLEIVMAAGALALLGVAVMSVRGSQARLHTASLTDDLTGLANRRALMTDLDAGLASATEDHPLLLALFDLDGFKSYNDSFGHPAGDALLVRLGARLRDATRDVAAAYRMGGDEFCVLANFGKSGPAAILDRAQDALSERGEGFSVTASFGAIVLPAESSDAAAAMRAADQRMYASKRSGRTSAGRQTTDALVRVLAERDPDLGDHMHGVSRLCNAVAETMGVPEDDRGPLLQAASLHDIGKAAVPDAILDKPGALDEREWAFIHQHTVIGERILASAPALHAAAALVRSSHERVDGTGYPDGLRGEEIPLGARIIAVCDAYDAMLSSRAYRRTPMSEEGALAELHRCSGSQFDPLVVEACTTVVTSPSIDGTLTTST